MSTEIIAKRLIDANELKKILESYGPMKGGPYAYGFEDCIEVVMNGIDEMPTIETTDDVLAGLPNFAMHNQNPTGTVVAFTTVGYAPDDYWEIKAEGSTVMEALKKLEASLNPK